MPRVKRGKIHVKYRRNLLKQVKGFKAGRKKLIRAASTAVIKAGVNAYRDRRKKKRNMRGLWQVRLNAAAREYGISYSKFIDALKKANIGLDRKVLSELAIKQPAIFKKIIESVTK